MKDRKYIINKSMFETKNRHLISKQAIQLAVNSLPGSVDMDLVTGYKSPYHLEWNNLKFLVKIANQTMKQWTGRYEWYYSLRKKDHEVADYFLLFALKESVIQGIYVIPKFFVPTSCITISKMNGNVRYDYFRTTIEGLPEKITEIQKKLPKLIKLYREAKSLKGAE